MNSTMLNEQQLQELQAMLDADTANPPAMEQPPEMEEAASPDEVDIINDTTAGMSEGESQAEDAQVAPDPNAGANPQAAAEAAQAAMPQLPDGLQSVEQLIEAYNMMKAAQGDVQAYRDMTAQLVSIAEALGYSKDIASVDLNFDQNDPNGAAKAEVHKVLGPMIEQQNAQMRQRLIDAEWKKYAGEHADLTDMMDDIREIIGADPAMADDEHGLERAHTMARARRYRPEKELMEDEAFIAKAAANEKIQNRVIEEYLRKVAKGGETAVKGVGSGGSIASSGAKKRPATMEEAKAGLLRMLGGE